MSAKGLLCGLGFVLFGALAAPDAAVAQDAGGVRTVAPQRSAISVQAAPPSGAPAARSSRSWMPVLGSLAAGGLLGALFGDNVLFGILMVALLVAIGAYIARLVLRARNEGMPAAQFAGMGSETVAAPPPSQAARPNEAAPSAGSAAGGLQLPEGFDRSAFLRAAKLNFVRLQIANDIGNYEEAREFSTPQMYAALSKGAFKRAGKPPHTDVVSLDAELTEIATQGDAQRASVRFSGMARSAPGAAAAGFAEIWHLARPADGSTGWLLARIQQAH